MTLTYDIDRICRGAELCIDLKWGDSRMKRVREAVDDGNSRKVSYFPKHLDPLNELVSLGKQSMPALAGVFQLILDKRSQIKGDTEKVVAIKERKCHTTATHRRLKQLAVQIETAKLRRKLTEEEKKDLLARKQKEWVVKRAAFYSTHAGYKSRADAYDAANAEIEGNLRTELIRVRSGG